MKNIHIAKYLGWVLLALAPQLHAQTAIKPQRDITTISLGGEEVSMLYTHIDKNNAHPIDTVTFFRSNSKGPAEHIPFQINDRIEPILQLRSGADCAMTGFRAFKAGDRLRVVYAQRDGNWADKRRVTFNVMDLKKNTDEDLDTPPIYFHEIAKVTTQSSYCDVNTALDTEAGLYRMGK
ncbi:carbapenem self-resistance protein CarG family protein [Pseudoduganella violaceinigra]|uniref:carbapenem self-resistance protein CarG family protein n=1 Tax=Pseudoduganella violaceinigra TaxID=246602 RepID=UPI0004120796|nr:hypothetical protein [Pseudoduganella violaceinigra]